MGIFKTLVGIGSFTLILHSQASAEVFFVPGDCEPNQASLLVKNPSSEPQAFWVQLHGDSLTEKRLELEAQTTLPIPADTFLNSREAFSVRTWQERRLQFTWQCGDQQTPLSTLTTPLVEHAVSPGTRQAHLKLINLTPGPNAFEIRFLSASRQVLGAQKIQLENYYETKELDLPLPPSTVRIQINAAGRIHSWLTYGGHKISPGYSREPQRLPASADKKYFLISTKTDNSESYVAATDNPEMIAQAREQIQNPRLEKIVVAKIVLGNGGYNRSFSGLERSPYSWSVSEINSFTDFAYIDCDGSPDSVEENLQTRLDEGGRICFWRYRIIRELSLEEVRRGF